MSESTLLSSVRRGIWKTGAGAVEAHQTGRKQKMDYSKSVVEERSRTEEERHIWDRAGSRDTELEQDPKAARNRRWTSLLGIELEQAVKNTMKLWHHVCLWSVDWKREVGTDGTCFVRLSTFMSVRCPELSHLQPAGIGWSVGRVGGQRGGTWVTWQEGTGACRQGVACGGERRTSAFKKNNTDWFLFCYEIRLLSVRVCVRGAQSIHADVSTLRESAIITLLQSSHTLHFNRTDHSTTHGAAQLM